MAVHSSVYPDSSASRAALDAAFLRAMGERVRVRGSAGYHRSPLGTFILFNEMQLEVDTSRALSLASSLKPQGEFIAGNAHLILLGEEPCDTRLSDSGRRRSGWRARDDVAPGTRRAEPDWVSKVPTHPGYLHALGYSDAQYYEVSSWRRAHWNALHNLASFQQAGIYSQINTLEGYAEEFQFLDVDQVLTGAQVVGRHHDARRGLYYVLMRVPR